VNRKSELAILIAKAKAAVSHFADRVANAKLGVDTEHDSNMLRHARELQAQYEAELEKIEKGG
jgi:hypothetical protein